jgi:hypothetical protein
LLHKFQGGEAIFCPIFFFSSFNIFSPDDLIYSNVL